MPGVRRPTGSRPANPKAPLRPTGRVAPGDYIPPVGSYPYRPTAPKAVDPPPPDETQARTVLDNVVPMVFGERRVLGFIGAWEYSDPSKAVEIGVVFAYGEQDSITTGTTYINGEVITAVTGITLEGVHTGDGSTAPSAVLTGMTGWAGADTTLWQSRAHAVMKINCLQVRSPSGLRIESDLGGMLIDASWRSGGSASTASTNPVEIAYHLMTSADYRDVATAKIHTASWEAVADWCDDVMGDGSARYEYNGIVSNRDPAAGVAEVLGLALAYEYIGDDGLIHLWCEMAPVAITGDWSASASATITEDATSGAAVADLTVGDYVYVGTNLRSVTTITDDDTVILDSAVTVSGVKVRRLSQTYIEKHEWAQPPSAHESSKLSTPDKYRMRFTDGTALGSHEVLSTYGAGTDKIVESSLPGCTSATVAARHGETTLKVAWTQPYYWQGIVGQDIGAVLEIGDVLLFDGDVLTQQAARVIPPLIARPDGTYVVNLREYDPGAYSDTTDTTDTVPNMGTGWTSAAVPIVSKLSSYYSGVSYDAISYDGSGRQTYGDTSRSTIMTGTEIRLPNNVPIYGLKTGGSTISLIKMDTSDRLVLGGGSDPIYAACTAFVVQRDAPIQSGTAADWGSRINLIEYQSATDTTQVSESGVDLILTGDKIALDTAGATVYFRGHLSGTGSAPTTTNLPNTNDFCIWEETDTNTWAWFVNDAGTIRQIS